MKREAISGTKNLWGLTATVGSERECPICHTVFCSPVDYTYKRPRRSGYHYFCSYTCMRSYDKERAIKKALQVLKTYDEKVSREKEIIRLCKTVYHDPNAKPAGYPHSANVAYTMLREYKQDKEEAMETLKRYGYTN